MDTNGNRPPGWQPGDRQNVVVLAECRDLSRTKVTKQTRSRTSLWRWRRPTPAEFVGVVEPDAVRAIIKTGTTFGVVINDNAVFVSEFELASFRRLRNCVMRETGLRVAFIEPGEWRAFVSARVMTVAEFTG